MSDHRGYGYPPAAGYGAYLLVRGIISLFQEPKGTSVPVVLSKPPIITPPPSRTRAAIITPLPAAIITPPPAAIITPPPTRPVMPSPPVVRWTEERELIAWRAWRLGYFLRPRGGDGGPRLLSITAPCVWNGPVVRDGLPLPGVERPSGIYALKLDVADKVQWQNEHCWVTGTVALSGRVVEHHLGYRAERAVVRELRLGVGAHLALRSLKQLREVMEALEQRYQVAVNAGQSDREIADCMLHRGHKPQCPKLPFVWDRRPWRLI